MQNKWLLTLGILCLVIGVTMLLISILIRRYIPGILVLIVVGIILISNSRKR